jgi:hypothetical protein
MEQRAHTTLHFAAQKRNPYQPNLKHQPDHVSRRANEAGAAGFLGDVRFLKRACLRFMCVCVCVCLTSTTVIITLYAHMRHTLIPLTTNAQVALVLIDEVHLLHEPGRGASLEAGVVSRIKMLARLPEMAGVSGFVFSPGKQLHALVLPLAQKHDPNQPHPTNPKKRRPSPPCASSPCRPPCPT